MINHFNNKKAKRIIQGQLTKSEEERIEFAKENEIEKELKPVPIKIDQNKLQNSSNNNLDDSCSFENPKLKKINLNKENLKQKISLSKSEFDGKTHLNNDNKKEFIKSDEQKINNEKLAKNENNIMNNEPDQNKDNCKLVRPKSFKSIQFESSTFMEKNDLNQFFGANLEIDKISNLNLQSEKITKKDESNIKHLDELTVSPIKKDKSKFNLNKDLNENEYFDKIQSLRRVLSCNDLIEDKQIKLNLEVEKGKFLDGKSTASPIKNRLANSKSYLSKNKSSGKHKNDKNYVKVCEKELEIEARNLFKDENLDFEKRMKIDIYKRQSKERKIKNVFERENKKIEEEKRIDAFNRLIKDANRRIDNAMEFEKKKEEIDLFQKSQNPKKIDKNQWKIIYDERFNQFQKKKTEKIESMMKVKNEKMKEKENIITDTRKPRKATVEDIQKSTLRLYSEAEKRKVKVLMKSLSHDNKKFEESIPKNKVNVELEDKSGFKASKRSILLSKKLNGKESKIDLTERKELKRMNSSILLKENNKKNCISINKRIIISPDRKTFEKQKLKIPTSPIPLKNYIISQDNSKTSDLKQKLSPKTKPISINKSRFITERNAEKLIDNLFSIKSK